MLTATTPTPRPPTHRYTPASVSYLSKAIGVINGYSFSHSLAAACAILYHLNCSKATEDNPGRLHPMYIALHDTVGSLDEQHARQRLLQDILADVLDAVREKFHVKYLKLMELSDCHPRSPRWRDIIFCLMPRLLYSTQFRCAGDLNRRVHQPTRSWTERWRCHDPGESSPAYSTIW